MYPRIEKSASRLLSVPRTLGLLLAMFALPLGARAQDATPQNPTPDAAAVPAPAPTAAPPAMDNEARALAQTRAYNSGLEALKRNDLENAGNHFQEAIRLAPGDAGALMFLGYVRLKQARYNDAVEALEAAHKSGSTLDPKSRAIVNNNLGLSYWNLKRPADAVQAYNRALTLNSEFEDARYNLAFALLAQKNYAEASKQFSALIKKNPKDAALQDGLGEALENSGDQNGAITAYRKASELEPQNALYPMRLAFLLIRTGRRVDAVKYLRQASKLDPNNPEALLHLGDFFVHQARWGEAQDVLSRYVSLRPEDFLGWFNLGVSYDFAAKFDQALQAYAQAERIKPRDAAVKNNIARIYYKRGRLEDAVTQCRKALEDDNEFLDARYNLALVLTGQGKLTEANKEWQTLIDTAARTLNTTGKAAEKKEARSVLVSARAALAENYLKAEQYADAADEYKRLLALDTANTAAMSNRGLALYHTKDYSGAADLYRAIIKREPNNAVAHNNLGVMLEALKDKTNALASYRQAVKLKPDYEHAKANLQRLIAGTRTG